MIIKTVKYIVYALIVLMVLSTAINLVLLASAPMSGINDIVIPPPKTEEHVRLEKISEHRGWTRTEFDRLDSLIKERNVLWDTQPTAGEFLATVENGKKQAMIKELKRRSLDDREIQDFINTINQDLPYLFE